MSKILVRTKTFKFDMAIIGNFVTKPIKTNSWKIKGNNVAHSSQEVLKIHHSGTNLTGVAEHF